ncbi:uncharacterized protein BCR38DRAFT_406638 [Pseudomassariella vexata]|uniref:Integral membrane protein n=1 Tax=Pseudomassariella vexata TaxID=1141098 RepID=A0A1Y2EBU5_9PEZI|nr:uncharacterized protein BCR38DRAFT_406638 [Pseudomassariella vexata]ORY68736.1 hypothetical protein BCR38DRAFT_406638 [Pseudomassariella vexata]
MSTNSTNSTNTVGCFGARPSQARYPARPFEFLNPTVEYVEASHEEVTATRRPHNAPFTPPPPPSHGHRDGDAKTGTGNSGVAAATTPAGVYRVWRSRDNRKGRHAVAISSERVEKKHGLLRHPKATDSWGQTWRGVGKMLVRYPVWDVSYDVALLFTLGEWCFFTPLLSICAVSALLRSYGETLTLWMDGWMADTGSEYKGSVIWVFNGFFVWLPAQLPSSEFTGEVDAGGGVTAFVGATIFEVGSVLLMLEAVNENRTECFGWALEEAFERESAGWSLLLRPNHEGCMHHHREKRALFVRKENVTNSAAKRSWQWWQWWPSWHDLTHYLREIGFLACLSQLIGATIFWVAGLTGLLPLYDGLSTPVANGVFWLPQVVGGTGFIISSWLFMVETQPNWYKPALKVLGWHVGFWNLVGAIGFTLCGALGFASENETASYVSALATFIGSWAFLTGSVVQWYESLNKYPVSLEKSIRKLSDSDSDG